MEDLPYRRWRVTALTVFLAMGAVAVLLVGLVVFAVVAR